MGDGLLSGKHTLFHYENEISNWRGVGHKMQDTQILQSLVLAEITAVNLKRNPKLDLGNCLVEIESWANV